MFSRFLFIFIIAISLGACNADKKNRDAKNEVVDETIATKVEAPETAPTEEKKAKEILTETAFNWQKLSGWHTQGTISRNSPIRIFFNRDIISKDLVGKDASKIIHISPAVKGIPLFESESKIVWLPTEPLEAGTEYKVSIKPGGLKDVPSNTSPFQFTFNVIPLEFEVKTTGLSTIPDTENEMLLTGVLLVSDRVDIDKVKQVLKASFQNKPLSIDWVHGSNAKEHNFTIRGINKETFSTELILSWDGKPIKIDSQGRKAVKVPGSTYFTLLSLKVVQDVGSNPYVQARFSDVLDRTQNLKGLVELTKNKFHVRINQNTINIYPNKNINGTFKVRLSQSIKSKSGKYLTENIIQHGVTFGETKPQVKFVGNGSILPDNSSLEIPFMAVGVNAVEVTALEIFPDNMRQFLQNNTLDGSSETMRTGRYLWRKTIPLTPADPNKWNRYSFDVTELMEKYHSGLLRLTLTIKRQHSTYKCSADKNKKKLKIKALRNKVANNQYEEVPGTTPNEDGSEYDGYYDYDWDNRNDPCYNAYYSYYNRQKTSDSQNFIASNIGLIAKQDSQGNLHVISTDLKTAEPLTGVDFEIQNFQGQTLATAVTDGDGFASVELTETPFLIIAKKFKDTAYLKVNKNGALAVSQFSVGGKKVKKGLKGMIYGERGVWRPGDNIFLTFVLEDSSKSIPDGHPVTMKLIDPRGRVVETKTQINSVGGFYAFKFKTKEKAQTGTWIAKAILGGSTFSKSLMIETVRPNRLKLELSFNASNDSANNSAIEDKAIIYSSAGTPKGSLFSQWLHGATASNLKADISVKFSKGKTKFKSFSDYIFDDPARPLKSEDKMLIEGKLDEEGRLNFEKDFKPKSPAPGLLKARFTTRVFEQGGAFSISRSSVDFHPYKNYVGLKLPESKSSYGLLYTNRDQTLNIASVNDKGEAVSLDKVRVSLYKINWRWWWDKPRESLAEFADGKHRDLLNNTVVSTVDGKATWDFQIKDDDWGRYLVRVCDLEGKHCAGKTVYIDWPDWSGRAQNPGSAAASRLELFSDKSAYSVGETAIIQLPTVSQGSALMTIETGSKVLEQRWINLQKVTKTSTTTDGKSKMQLEIPITAEMSPNAYIHISLIQPHAGKKNDRPIRLYGIIPLEVSNPDTYLKPTIMVDKEWKPQSKQTIKVSETNGKDMNYTLAVVDEGLLGLTAFKTPNLHRHFYSKEALGISTWDLYDQVIGAYGGKLERMLALGGGDEAEVDNEDSKKRRFPPVVRFLGPFHLNGGETAEHEIELPPYLGAVRVMVVAGDNNVLSAYGKAQESVFIRQPLMLQVSLPRTLGPDEEVAVPVTLFATDDSIKDVKITIKTDDLVSVIGDPQTQIHFDKTGEKIAFIKLKTAKKIGKTHIHFVATAMTEKDGQQVEQKSEANIYLNIDQANKETSRSITKVIEPNSNWNAKGDAFGLEGTNKAVLELSSVPSLNLEKRLSYLIRYPHGCLEQTTSSAFPQLYLSKVMKLNEKKQKSTQLNINKAIYRLQNFQLNSGNFSYWPGGNHENTWASIYAGHFLVEAKKKGFLVPTEFLNNWLGYQVDTAQGYVLANSHFSHTQAYRLYVLALAGKPQLGAMNRMREHAHFKNTSYGRKARWLLAAAYQSASQPEAAKAVIQGLLPEVAKVATTDRTFSSTLGDLGIQLESLVALNKKQDAYKLVEEIADEMRGDRYQSTQGIAWALMAVSRYLGGDTSHFTAKLSVNNKPSEINSDKPISSIDLANANSSVTLENTSAIKLFATLVNLGVPDAGVEKSLEKGLSLKVFYDIRDKQNKKIWRAIEDGTIVQGSDVRFTVSVENTTKSLVENIALTIPVAAGMEIISADEQQKAKSKYDYRDLRDDRIHYYFSLAKGKTKTFQLMTNAAYKGSYYLPAINAEAMYDGTMQARKQGQWINIIGTEDDAGSQSSTVAPDSKVDANQPKEVIIKSPKAYLYDSPAETTITAMYLVKSDKAELLNEVTDSDNKRWLYIHFEGKKTLEKWIKAETVE